MKTSPIHIFTILLCAVCFPLSTLAEPGLGDYDGWVVTVLSGDTIRVLDGSSRVTKVRLKSIDAPQRGQPFGEESRKALASLLSGKQVKVNTRSKDGYGNMVATVWVTPQDCPSCKKTLDANHAQLLAGMAWWYRRFSDQQKAEERARYESAELEAKKRQLGLWADPDPEPPWMWRERTGQHEN